MVPQSICQSQQDSTKTFKVNCLDKYILLGDDTVNSIMLTVSDLRNNGVKDQELIKNITEEFEGISSPFAGVTSDANYRLTNIYDICENTWHLMLDDIIALSIFNIPIITTNDERLNSVFETELLDNQFILKEI